MTLVPTKRKTVKAKKPSKSPYNVLQYQMLGVEVNVSLDNGRLAYTFERGGKSYGNTIKVESALPADVISAAFLLAANAAESINGFDSKSEN